LNLPLWARGIPQQVACEAQHHEALVGSLIPQPVLVYIPGFWHEALTGSLILGPVTRLYTGVPA